MQYFEYQPYTLLSKYIEYFWFFKAEGYNSSSIPEDLHLPDNSPEWYFKVLEQEKSRIAFRGKDHSFLIHTRPTEVFGIRFRPYGLFQIGDVNMREFNGVIQSVPAHQVFPELAKRLEEIILQPDSVRQRIKQMEVILKERVCQIETVDDVVIKIVHELALKNGNIRIKDLCKTYNLSRVSLSNKFEGVIGCSPKKAARICRLNFLLRKGVQEPDKTLTKLAHECGYFDQAHLNHDFKSLTGITPSQFFRHSSSVIVRS